MIVDLEALEFIDCAALRALADAQQRARQARGGLLLAAPAGKGRGQCEGGTSGQLKVT